MIFTRWLIADYKLCIKTSKVLLITLYEINGLSYKWLAKYQGEDFYLEGEVTKVE
tara:strand:+ start:803 stop:967 length:165 start_codon:yes stop_codon:yes gene_type:complete